MKKEKTILVPFRESTLKLLEQIPSKVTHSQLFYDNKVRELFSSPDVMASIIMRDIQIGKYTFMDFLKHNDKHIVERKIKNIMTSILLRGK